MRLLIACRAIDKMAGGVERQAIALANEMTQRGHQVSLLTLDPEAASAFYEIDPKVQWLKLGIGDPKIKAGWKLRMERMKKVRAIMRDFQPDTILAFQDGMFTTLYFYTLGLNIPIIAAERESPYRYDFVKTTPPRFFISFIYLFARAVTVQCQSYVDAYPKMLRNKITVIPNSVYPASQYAAPRGLEAEKKTILCVGRLAYQKNQIILLKAFAKLHKKYPDWSIELVGDGEDQQKIITEVEQLSLQDRVRFIGAVSNVTDYYKSAHFLCIPSYWEGFPNVLSEALAHGLPAVGYQGCGGVRDLIVHAYNGWLVEGNGELESLVDGLDKMMCDDALREKMGKAAIQSIQPYTPSIVYDQWESFLKGSGKAS